MTFRRPIPGGTYTGKRLLTKPLSSGHVTLLLARPQDRSNEFGATQKIRPTFVVGGLLQL
jgi:hypothetical protein